MKEGNKKHMVWTKEDDKVIKRLLRQGASLVQIARMAEKARRGGAK